VARKCSFEACGRPHKGHGLCAGHLRQQRLGQELKPLQVQRSREGRSCKFEGCGKPVDARDLCSGHYQQWQKGKELTELKQRQEGCSVEECPNKHYSLGYCELHYGRVKKHGDPHRGWRASHVLDSGSYLMVEMKGGRGEGQWALIDYCDRELVEGYSFSLATGGYARRWSSERQCLVELHREIMGFPQGKQVDHINGNRLDNRRGNLRLVTFAEQMQNKKPWAKSGHRNVHEWQGKYRVMVRKDGKVHYGGTFEKEDVALAVASAQALRDRLFTHHVEERSCTTPTTPKRTPMQEA